MSLNGSNWLKIHWIIAGERSLHTREVTGSIPVSPTIFRQYIVVND